MTNWSECTWNRVRFTNIVFYPFKAKLCSEDSQGLLGPHLQVPGAKKKKTKEIDGALNETKIKVTKHDGGCFQRDESVEK